MAINHSRGCSSLVYLISRFSKQQVGRHFARLQMALPIQFQSSPSNNMGGPHLNSTHPGGDILPCFSRERALSPVACTAPPTQLFPSPDLAVFYLAHIARSEHTPSLLLPAQEPTALRQILSWGHWPTPPGTQELETFQIPISIRHGWAGHCAGVGPVY